MLSPLANSEHVEHSPGPVEELAVWGPGPVLVALTVLDPVLGPEPLVGAAPLLLGPEPP